MGMLGYMPSIKELENPSSAIASEIYAADGTLLGTYYYQNRSNAKYSEISPNVFNALIATEDERFKEHSGIDGRAILRAIGRLGRDGGGSTITQQLAKNLFPRENVSLFTLPFIKLKEWVMAVKLEKNLTKNEIITLYLNTVPFGDNTYGIKNASKTFFNKEPLDLSIDEAAVLVGMLKGNTLYNPRRNPERSLARRNTVIDQMVKSSMITSLDAASYKGKPLKLNYNVQDHNEGIATYFRQVVEQEVKKWCKQHEKEDGTKYDIYKDGLKIYTTLDPKMQQYAEEAVEKHMKELQATFWTQPNIRTGSVWSKGKPKEVLNGYIQGSPRYKALKNDGMRDSEIMKVMETKTKMTVFSWKNTSRTVDTFMTPIDSIKYTRSFLQAGFMAMDPITGEVKAWVGGINHKYFQYDHVNIGTKRQVGSTIKPLLYCLAVDNGYSPCSSVSTSPQKFAGLRNYYNAGGRGGMMRMSSALASSVNNASLYLLNQTGIQPFIDFAHRCGISSNIEKVPSIALGVSDISMFEMLWSYTMFPNRGINTQPVFISKIEDKNGNLLESFTPKQKEIISAETAYKMVKMMEGVIDNGTARRLRRMGAQGDIAGKTGTTNNQADAWFIGYTPQILAGAWVGCDDRFLRFNSTALGQGAAAALPIWGYFYQKISADKKSGIDTKAKFVEPENFSLCGDKYSNGGGGSYYSGGGSSSHADSNGSNDANSNNGTEVEPDETEPVPVLPDEVPNDEWK